jgi:hypothetical protein
MKEINALRGWKEFWKLKISHSSNGHVYARVSWSNSGFVPIKIFFKIAIENKQPPIFKSRF